MQASANLLIEQGVAKGAVQGKAGLLAIQLAKRHGELPTPYRRRLGEASLEELDALGERLLEADTLEAVFAPSPGRS